VKFWMGLGMLVTFRWNTVIINGGRCQVHHGLM